jgi:hypothetical protein
MTSYKLLALAGGRLLARELRPLIPGAAGGPPRGGRFTSPAHQSRFRCAHPSARR